MDIITLAAWGEFLGGIAVVFSLIYLASQIRQNSKLLRVSTTISVCESDIEFAKLRMADPEMMLVVRAGFANRESLTAVEQERFDTFLDLCARVLQKSYFVQQDGAMKQSLWQGEQQGMAWILRQPGSRQWWDESGHTFCNEFGEFVDVLLREGEAAG
jgi:hypothetical protein